MISQSEAGTGERQIPAPPYRKRRTRAFVCICKIWWSSTRLHDVARGGSQYKFLPQRKSEMSLYTCVSSLKGLIFILRYDWTAFQTLLTSSRFVFASHVRSSTATRPDCKAYLQPGWTTGPNAEGVASSTQMHVVLEDYRRCRWLVRTDCSRRKQGDLLQSFLPPY
jgi:hypothetical protein